MLNKRLFAVMKTYVSAISTFDCKHSHVLCSASSTKNLLRKSKFRLLITGRSVCQMGIMDEELREWIQKPNLRWQMLRTIAYGFGIFFFKAVFKSLQSNAFVNNFDAKCLSKIRKKIRNWHYVLLKAHIFRPFLFVGSFFFFSFSAVFQKNPLQLDCHY